MREPIFAGLFYEGSPAALRKQIRSCFLGKLGPGVLPAKSGRNSILGAVVPHAGYSYSGMCAAWAYKEISETHGLETVIILGTSHSGMGSGLLLDDWKTPLGIVKTDVELAKEIIRGGEIRENFLAHQREHSIEVQLPFLKFISPKVKIVGIVADRDLDYKKAGATIMDAIKNLKRKAVVLASSDFTHYGPEYGYVPFFENVKERMRELDMKAVELIIKGDDAGLLGYVVRTGATICGVLPIVTMLKTIQFKKAELLNYYTSGDLTGSYRNAVGYASIIFR
ncbi:MAG: AmmeMemoRadiSam system protein B [Candidatus Woesearchaeota archaeon]